MNSEDNSEYISTLALAPFVRFFTYAVVKSMRIENYPQIRSAIHTDMVPKYTKEVVMSTLGEKNIQITQEKSQAENPKPTLPKVSLPKSQVQQLPSRHDIKRIHEFQPNRQFLNQSVNSVPPLNPPSPRLSNPPLLPRQNQMPMPRMPAQSFESPVQEQKIIQMPPPPLPPPRITERRSELSQELPPRPSLNPPSPIAGSLELPMNEAPLPEINQGEGDELSQFYGKITPLLNDPSIAIIECAGMGRPLMVVRRGHKQPTKIVLTEKEIKQVLDKVSESAHIPILEGVFRAAVDTFSINAVISEMIGSRFVIKKVPSQMSAPMY